MATILAANTGNWSATGTWTGGVVPVAGDIVVANGKTVTIDTLNVTVAELRNDTTGGAVVGGTFNMVSGGTVNADVYVGATTNHCVLWSGILGQNATITGRFFGGSNNGSAVVCNTSNLTVGGGSQLTGGTVTTNGSYGLFFASSGTLTFATSSNPGVIVGGTTSQSGGPGLNCNAANSTIVIYASSIRGNTSGLSAGINFTGTNQNVTIVAGSIGASNQTATAIQCSGASGTHTYTVSGDVQGGSGGPGINLQGSGTYNITVAGNVSGGSGGNQIGIYHQNTTATINCTANVVNNVAAANGGNYSLNNASTGTLNLIGTATAGAAQITAVNASAGILRVTRAKGNGYGAGSAGISNVVAVASNAQGSLTYVEEIEFGPLGAIPVSGPIRLTALTTNKAIVCTTTGTMKTLVDTLATSGIVPNASDVRLNTVYNSGNSTGSCAVPPASSVVFGVPVDNTTGTAILTPASLRAAIGLNSANLDAQIDAIPTAAENASAVRSELTPELTRISNCATVATTGQQIQDALI